MRDKIPRADIYLGFEIICARLRLPLYLKSYKSLLERREEKNLDGGRTRTEKMNKQNITDTLTNIFEIKEFAVTLKQSVNLILLFAVLTNEKML